MSRARRRRKRSPRPSPRREIRPRSAAPTVRPARSPSRAHRERARFAARAPRGVAGTARPGAPAGSSSPRRRPRSPRCPSCRGLPAGRGDRGRGRMRGRGRATGEPHRGIRRAASPVRPSSAAITASIVRRLASSAGPWTPPASSAACAWRASARSPRQAAAWPASDVATPTTVTLASAACMPRANASASRPATRSCMPCTTPNTPTCDGSETARASSSSSARVEDTSIPRQARMIGVSVRLRRSSGSRSSARSSASRSRAQSQSPVRVAQAMALFVSRTYQGRSPSRRAMSIPARATSRPRRGSVIHIELLRLRCARICDAARSFSSAKLSAPARRASDSRILPMLPIAVAFVIMPSAITGTMSSRSAPSRARSAHSIASAFSSARM